MNGMDRKSLDLEPRLEAEYNQEVAETISVTERFNRLVEITRDPQVKQGMEAFLRTGVNAGISVADLFPVVGEAASWTADACKLIAHRFNLNMLDTSPDVSVKIALGTEALEICTGGVMPSHVIETTLQLRADWPRIKGAYQKVKDIWSRRRQELNRSDLQTAVAKFAK